MDLRVVRFNAKGVLLYFKGEQDCLMTHDFLLTKVGGTDGHVPDIVDLEGRFSAGFSSVFCTNSILQSLRKVGPEVSPS